MSGAGVAIGSTDAHDMLIAAPSALLAGTLRAAIMSGIDSAVDEIVLDGMYYEVRSPFATILSADG